MKKGVKYLVFIKAHIRNIQIYKIYKYHLKILTPPTKIWIRVLSCCLLVPLLLFLLVICIPKLNTTNTSLLQNYSILRLNTWIWIFHLGGSHSHHCFSIPQLTSHSFPSAACFLSSHNRPPHLPPVLFQFSCLPKIQSLLYQLLLPSHPFCNFRKPPIWMSHR